jgi:hypothetical protein
MLSAGLLSFETVLGPSLPLARLLHGHQLAHLLLRLEPLDPLRRQRLLQHVETPDQLHRGEGGRKRGVGAVGDFGRVNSREGKVPIMDTGPWDFHPYPVQGSPGGRGKQATLSLAASGAPPVMTTHRRLRLTARLAGRLDGPGLGRHGAGLARGGSGGGGHAARVVVHAGGLGSCRCATGEQTTREEYRVRKSAGAMVNSQPLSCSMSSQGRRQVCSNALPLASSRRRGSVSGLPASPLHASSPRVYLGPP